MWLSRSAILLVMAFAVHLLSTLLSFLSHAVEWLQWLRYVAWAVQVPVILFAFMASVMFAYSCEAFFIKPILATTAEGGDKYTVLVQSVRTRAVIVIPVLIALITLYVEIF